MNELYKLYKARHLVNMIKGEFSNSAFEKLLKASGYDVLPYGYEITYREICNDVRKGLGEADIVRKYEDVKCGMHLDQIRSTPDLKIVNKEEGLEELVESKFSGETKDKQGNIIRSQSANDVSINREKLQSYQMYWENTIMVFTFAHLEDKKYHCIRAKDVTDDMIIEMHNKYDNYDISEKARPLKYFFPRVSDELIKLNMELVDDLQKDLLKPINPGWTIS